MTATEDDGDGLVGQTIIALECCSPTVRLHTAAGPVWVIDGNDPRSFLSLVVDEGNLLGGTVLKVDRHLSHSSDGFKKFVFYEPDIPIKTYHECRVTTTYTITTEKGDAVFRWEAATAGWGKHRRLVGASLMLEQELEGKR